jgi:DNA-directed RNA polymerase subunit E'/Rpb7
MKPFPKEISTTVILAPESMNKDWQLNLFHAVCRNLVGKCTLADGYITSVLRITKIHNQQIARVDGSIRFHINVLSDVILPKVGDIVDVDVDMIFPHGVFCCHRTLRMMMPLSKCHGFVLKPEFSNLYLLHPTSKHTIRKGDTIPVIVDDARFESNLYSCLVSLNVDRFKNMT